MQYLSNSCHFDFCITWHSIYMVMFFLVESYGMLFNVWNYWKGQLSSAECFLCTGNVLGAGGTTKYEIYRAPTLRKICLLGQWQTMKQPICLQCKWFAHWVMGAKWRILNPDDKLRRGGLGMVSWRNEEVQHRISNPFLTYHVWGHMEIKEAPEIRT